jgi:integrase
MSMEAEQVYAVAKTKQGVEVRRLATKRILDYSAYYLTADEIKRIKDAASSFGKLAPTYLAIISLMVNCGLRRGEVVSLRCNQVNFDNKRVELGTETKTRTPRSIPFNAEVERTLRMVVGSRVASSEFVFKHRSGVMRDERLVYSDRRYSTVSINLIVAKLGRIAHIEPKAAGMANVNPHLLRHSWVKLCKGAGIPEDFVRVMGGWSSKRMIQNVYGIPTYDAITTEVASKVNW